MDARTTTSTRITSTSGRRAVTPVALALAGEHPLVGKVRATADTESRAGQRRR